MELKDTEHETKLHFSCALFTALVPWRQERRIFKLALVLAILLRRTMKAQFWKQTCLSKTCYISYFHNAVYGYVI